MKRKTPIFISGPHGSGKTTLINNLLKNYNLFIKNDFDIDFISQFPSFKTLSHFERCFLRLYHRIYISMYANSLAPDGGNKIRLVNRGVYDSEAYINAYKEIGLINRDSYELLKFIMKNFNYKLNLNTIILNPTVEIVMERLQKRIKTGERILRNNLFKFEDTYEFVNCLSKYFRNQKNREGVLYIEDNSDVESKKIINWVHSVNIDE